MITVDDNNYGFDMVDVQQLGWKKTLVGLSGGGNARKIKSNSDWPKSLSQALSGVDSFPFPSLYRWLWVLLLTPLQL